MGMTIPDGKTATARYSMSTGIGMHKLPERFRIRALAKGLTCELTTAGGWFTKEHLLVVKGPADTVRLWVQDVKATLDAMAGCEGDPVMSRADLDAYIEKRHNALRAELERRLKVTTEEVKQ